MSGDSLRVPNGVSLSAATSDLVLAARKDILLDTQLEGSREVAIRSLRDNLNNVTMGAKIWPLSGPGFKCEWTPFFPVNSKHYHGSEYPSA